MNYIIDSDSHFLLINSFDLVNDSFKEYLPKMVFDHTGELTISVDNNPNHYSINSEPLFNYSKKYKGVFDLKERLNDFQKLKINFQILHPELHSLCYSWLVEQKLAVEMCRSYNRMILETIREYKNYFAASILITIKDIDWSISEIAWAKQQGFNIVNFDLFNPKEEGVAGPLSKIDGFEKLCKACVDNDMVINLHGGFTHQKFFSKDIIGNTLLSKLFPSTYNIAVTDLIISKIFEKFPDLKIVVSEGGMRFINRCYNFCKNDLKIENTDRIFSNNLWFTIEPEQTENLIKAVNLFGPERFLFATDYPHNDEGGMNRFFDVEDLVSIYKHNQYNLKRMFYLNALELFRLDHLTPRVN